MKNVILIIFAITIVFPNLFGQSKDLSPQQILNKTIEAMGGKEKIEKVELVRLKGIQVDNLYSVAVGDKGAIPKMFWEIDRILDLK